VFRQQLVDAIVVPTGFAELDRVPIACRKRAQEVLESRQVEFPPRRKLVEDRAESRTQLRRAVEEAEQGILGILQLLHVRQEPAGFDGI
jgi:hypothetical protein